MTKTIRFKLATSEVALGMDEFGAGRQVVLLPALSSISTRHEMRPLAARLSLEFRVTTVDWPGFGDLPRPREDWTPDILSRFLDWFLSEVVAPPHMIVAAGHAATYALDAAARRPGVIERLALVAPTWRGPLPTMMGGQRDWFARVRAAIDNPVTGPLLYRLNVSRPVLNSMARRHVYSQADWLTGDQLAEKLSVTGAPGARHSSVRFVSGALDRVDSRSGFLDLARRAEAPILVVYGGETPPRSLAEMGALAELPDVRLLRVAGGKLAIHEETPDAVAAAVAPFLREG